MDRYRVTVTDKGTVIYRRVVESPLMEQALADLKTQFKCAPLGYCVESEQYEGQFDNVVPFMLEKTNGS